MRVVLVDWQLVNPGAMTLIMGAQVERAHTFVDGQSGAFFLPSLLCLEICLPFLRWGGEVDWILADLGDALHGLVQAIASKDVLFDMLVLGSPGIDKFRAKRVNEELLVCLPVEVVLVILDLKLVEAVEDFFALVVRDYHRVDSLRFRILDQIVIVVEKFQLVYAIQHCLPLVVLDV